jgi:hypothetical protein
MDQRSPVGATMSAWEAISWIAFGEIRATTPGDDFRDLATCCQDHWPWSVLQALRARAAREPYCACDLAIWRTALDHAKLAASLAAINGIIVRRDDSYKTKPLSQESPRLLRRVLWEFRRREGRPVRLADVVKILDQRLRSLVDNERLVHWARLELAEAIERSRVTAMGKAWTRQDGDGPHVAVSPIVFSADRLILTDLGTIARDNSQGGHYRYRDLQFLTSEILTLRPPGSNGEGLPPDLARDPKAVEAYEAMLRHQKARVGKRDALARIIAVETRCTVRLARQLYRYLPDEFKNRARKLRP